MAQERIAEALANDEIAKMAANLSSEAEQCGITADSFRTLAIQMVATNNQKLSFEQQTAALKALGIEADLAAAKIAGVNGVKNQKYSQPRGTRGNVDRRGGLITSYGQEIVDGQVYLVYYGEGGAVVDRERIGGTTSGSTPVVTPNYSGAASGGGGSSKASSPKEPTLKDYDMAHMNVNILWIVWKSR